MASYASKHALQSLSNKPFVRTYTHKTWNFWSWWMFSISNDCYIVRDILCVDLSCTRDLTGELWLQTCIGSSLIPHCVYTASPYIHRSLVCNYTWQQNSYASVPTWWWFCSASFNLGRILILFCVLLLAKYQWGMCFWFCFTVYVIEFVSSQTGTWLEFPFALFCTAGWLKMLRTWRKQRDLESCMLAPSITTSVMICWRKYSVLLEW